MITLNLDNIKEYQLLRVALGKMPFDEVFPLINKVEQQVQAQLIKPTPANKDNINE